MWWIKTSDSAKEGETRSIARTTIPDTNYRPRQRHHSSTATATSPSRRKRLSRSACCSLC